MSNLAERVGVTGFAFFTRGHIHDSIVPTWIDSDGGAAFITEVLGHDCMDMMTRFEQWACARNRGAFIPCILPV
jgi:hypothetical protein